MDEDINLDNDFEPEFTVTRKNATTGAIEAATGLSSQQIWISATKGGAAIGALTVNASERGTLGIYYGVFDGDALRTALATSYLNKRVWVMFGDSTNILRATSRMVRQYPAAA